MIFMSFHIFSCQPWLRWRIARFRTSPTPWRGPLQLRLRTLDVEKAPPSGAAPFARENMVASS